MLDASLTFAGNGNRYRLSVYGRNLLNQVTFGGDTPLPVAFGGPGASLSPLSRGRVIGAELSFSY